MIINNNPMPKSSFLSTEKDLNILISQMCNNIRLKKLLYWDTQDALSKAPLNEEQTASLFGKNIKIVPKLTIDGTVNSYIIISFDNFTRSGNPEFRDNIIEFDIICNFDQWHLADFQLRPYKIAAEIDSMFDGTKLSGIGTLEFLGANQLILTENYGGICLMYQAVHGGEDEKDMPNPADEEQFIKDFKDSLK